MEPEGLLYAVSWARGVELELQEAAVKGDGRQLGRWGRWAATIGRGDGEGPLHCAHAHPQESPGRKQAGEPGAGETGPESYRQV